MSRRSVLEVSARLVPENPHWQAEQKLELFRAFCRTLALSRFATMSKHKLLKRLLAALATNDGVQPESRETWQRLKSLTPREVDVLCKILGESGGIVV